MDIKITSFTESEDYIRFLRDTVFGKEQGVSRELDWDGEDTGCIHVLACNGSGIPVGTGRMRLNGRIGRLAVLENWRGKGVGGNLLESLVGDALERRFKSVYLHAQTQAISFYEKHGFCMEGEKFIEAGISHVKMVKDLKPVP